jgi:antitoxin component of RelBE/YafQ-DinJ toxin-antitoxin module
MAIKIVSMQIKISEAVRERAKEFAKERGMNLNDLVLELFAKVGDKELKKLGEI